MKYKHKLKRLQNMQSFWDRQPESYKRACKRSGSIKNK